MHTTLDVLKTNSACKPGYGRMISFFGDSKKYGNQIIPLYAVSLIGGGDDAKWTLINSAIINMEDYQAFYRKHLPSVLKYLAGTKLTNSGLTSVIKNPIHTQLREELKNIQTFEECQAWLDKARCYSFSGTIFEHILRSRVWTTPSSFIAFCIDHCNETFYSNDRIMGESLYIERAPTDVPVVSTEAVAIPFTPDGPELEEGEEESRDVEDYDEDEDDRPRRAVPTPRGRAAAKRKENVKRFWFLTSKEGRTTGQQVAFLFTETPFDFVEKLEYKIPRGVKVQKKPDGGVELQLAVSDNEKVYNLLRTITKRSSEMVDPDCE